MRHPTLYAATLTLATLLTPACHLAQAHILQPAHGTLASIDVTDRTTGEPLPVYVHNGQRWIAGTPGHRYSIGVHNLSSGRVLSVVSVDGVNAVSGETADWAQSGYVLSPWDAFDVLGWRKSLEHVADFVFTSVDASYAARTGRPDNVGVIGVAVFRERESSPPIGLSEDSRRQLDAPSRGATGNAESAPSPAAPSAKSTQEAPRQALGTGHGETEASAVSTTDFQRAGSRPDLLISIRYDSREHLIAMGVIRDGRHPQAFPQAAGQSFVPDPPSLQR